MLLPRVTRVFRSRWSALWWAAGILFLASRVATADGLTGRAASQATPPADPWAIDSQ